MAGNAFQSDPRTGGDLRNLYKVAQNTTRLLLGAGDLIVGWLLMRQAEVAKAALDAGADNPKDEDFYTGKIAAAKFFTHQVLPRLAAERAMAEATDNCRSWTCRSRRSSEESMDENVRDEPLKPVASAQSFPAATTCRGRRRTAAAASVSPAEPFPHRVSGH
jgi:hypothetical protein